MIKRIAKSRWTIPTIRVVGFCFLIGYLIFIRDLNFSIWWALAFPASAFLISQLIVSLKLSIRIPKLNRYLIYPSNSQVASSVHYEDKQELEIAQYEWALNKAKYLLSGMPKASILFAATEDGFICVPLLMAGISPISSAVGGLVFGFLHLGRFTYLECIGKSIYYTLVCLVILQHGLLTVVFGHLMMDFIASVLLKSGIYFITRKLRSNAAVPHDEQKTPHPL